MGDNYYWIRASLTPKGYLSGRQLKRHDLMLRHLDVLGDGSLVAVQLDINGEPLLYARSGSCLEVLQTALDSQGISYTLYNGQLWVQKSGKTKGNKSYRLSGICRIRDIAANYLFTECPNTLDLEVDSVHLDKIYGRLGGSLEFELVGNNEFLGVKNELHS